jgi:hypothetical protein
LYKFFDLKQISSNSLLLIFICRSTRVSIVLNENINKN